MRKLLFKNLTSNDKKRRTIVSSEIVDKQGVRRIIQRHFVCIVKEIKYNRIQKPLPHLYVLKEYNSKEQKEIFLCKIKGSVNAIYNGRLFQILYMHTLKITLLTIPQDLIR